MTVATSPIKRLRDWQSRFDALCKSRRRTPFQWGVHDCCLWAADAVHALTGHDPAAAWRGTYGTVDEAAHLVAQLGGLRGIVTTALGEPTPTTRAGVGDVVLLEHGSREVLAVCNGTEALVVTQLGLQVLGMQAARAAWRV